MTTKFHYGTAIVASGLGVLAGILVRKSGEARDIDAEARKRGYIKPQECPPPCPPPDQITDQGTCERCGGTWIPPTGPYSKGECIPGKPSGPGTPGTPEGPTTVQPGPSGDGTIIVQPGPIGGGINITQAQHIPIG